MTILKSQLDQSVNFINGSIEARYVRRAEEYFVCYLSSQTGCARRCRMCYLTFSNQTDAKNLTRQEIVDQAEEVLHYYNDLDGPKARRVKFAFMARGEPLANPSVDDYTLLDLAHLAIAYNLTPEITISTIFPHDSNLVTRFSLSKPSIYYSVYSLDPVFRKKWLPTAINPEIAFKRLDDYSRSFKKVNTLHWAFIDGENDSLLHVGPIADKVAHGHYDVNIVRYNPPSNESKETDEENILRLTSFLKDRLPQSSVKIVDRVGYDVFASCGMFVPKG